MSEHAKWLENPDEIIEALIADEAKLTPMIISMEQTLRQMKAKNSFRIALLNQLREQRDQTETK